MTAPVSPEPCPCHQHNGFGRRVALFGGLIVIFAAMALKYFVRDVSDWLVLGGMLIGGSLIPNTKVIELLNAWQKKPTAP